MPRLSLFAQSERTRQRLTRAYFTSGLAPIALRLLTVTEGSRWPDDQILKISNVPLTLREAKPLRSGEAMIRRRANRVSIKTRIGNHTFRAIGITAHLKNPQSKLEIAQAIANHESPRTTKLYDRRQDEIALDEAERIGI